MTRKLRLNRETLAELSTDDLSVVVGGAPPTLNVRDCLPSMDYSCINCISHPPCTI